MWWKAARVIEVMLFNDKVYDAHLVGHDPLTDVAVIKIDAPPEELYPVVFGDSGRLRVGQRIFALGNPFGFDRTLSTGIVSSLDRMLPSRSKAGRIKQIIQIDASINPGSSGGPLLDSHARMIGMNTAIASKTGESAGVGFAIPINTIARVVPATHSQWPRRARGNRHRRGLPESKRRVRKAARTKAALRKEPGCTAPPRSASVKGRSPTKPSIARLPIGLPRSTASPSKPLTTCSMLWRPSSPGTRWCSR